MIPQKKQGDLQTQTHTCAYTFLGEGPRTMVPASIVPPIQPIPKIALPTKAL